jgi:hypothetical protein
MDYRQFGRSGLKVPVLSFGTATFGGSNEAFRRWGETDVAEATRSISVSTAVSISSTPPTSIPKALRRRFSARLDAASASVPQADALHLGATTIAARRVIALKTGTLLNEHCDHAPLSER